MSGCSCCIFGGEHSGPRAPGDAALPGQGPGAPGLRGPAWRTHSSQETQLGGRALSLTGPASGNRSLKFGVKNRKPDQSSTCSQWVLHPHPWPFLRADGPSRSGTVTQAEWGWAEDLLPLGACFY